MDVAVHRPIRRLRLADGAGIDPRVRAEHPHLAFEPGAAAEGDAVIDAPGWRTLADFTTFDGAVAEGTSDVLALRGHGAAEVAAEVLTRFQRHAQRTNEASGTALFAAVLTAHRALHDLDKPLVKADHDHAVDAWQWMLRLDPAASLAAQLAVLFHDIERLVSEPDVRVEQHAPDYQAFKDAHARTGASWARVVLLEQGVPLAVADRVHALVAGHERRDADPEGDLLNDADALSFFSLNSAGYANYFGPEQTTKKVRYTLRRLSPRGRAKLRFVKLRPDVQRIFDEVSACES
ncbi:MAG: hypothetical protein JWP97_5640 [Labilithrix sp.]|nr:hypothetical protein [Labilithrix sp.]